MMGENHGNWKKKGKRSWANLDAAGIQRVRVNIYFCNHFKGLVVKNSNLSNRKVTLINKFMDLSPV